MRLFLSEIKGAENHTLRIIAKHVQQNRLVLQGFKMLVGRFWDLIDANGEYKEVEHELLKLASPYGVNAVSCLEIRAPVSTSLFVGRMFGKRDGEYLIRYRREKLDQHDVAAQEVLKTDAPFYWADVFPKARNRNQQAVFDIAREHGLGDGFLAPFYGAGGRIGFTGFYGLELCDAPSTRRLLGFAGQAFYRYAYTKAQAEEDAQREKILLTDRQVEVLYWISKGKTDWEMSLLLGISEPTVNKHVESAKKRIGVRSRAEAVHYAMMHSLIQPG